MILHLDFPSYNSGGGYFLSIFHQNPPDSDILNQSFQTAFGGCGDEGMFHHVDLCLPPAGKKALFRMIND